MKTYTCNVINGDFREQAENAGYHAYYANGTTAIEVKATGKIHAKELLEVILPDEAEVVYVYE